MAERTAILIDRYGDPIGTEINPLVINASGLVAVASGQSMAITPTHRGCLVEWNDANGYRIKDADIEAYVPYGFFVRTPQQIEIDGYNRFYGKYKHRVYANLRNTAQAGFVDLTEIEQCVAWDHVNMGVVINMVDNVNTSQIGCGLLCHGHFGYSALEFQVDGGNYQVMKFGENRVLAPEFPYGIFSYGVNIPASYTYDVGGSPHSHDERYLQLTGGVLVGGINLSNNRIIQVGTPLDGGDAINRDYVSGLMSGIYRRQAILSIVVSSPSTPDVGARYLIDDSGTSGAFVGHEDEIATWTVIGWSYETPDIGWAVLNLDDSFSYVYGDIGWCKFEGVKSHSSLTGLTSGDDHLQYVHISISRVISAQHTFSFAGSPFLVSSDTLIENLNANFLDGASKDDLALAGHTHGFDALTGFEITNPASGDGFVYDLALGKFVNSPVSGSGYSILSIPSKYQFVDDEDRDSYFAENPSELVDGAFIAVASGFEQYNLDVASWEDRTAVLRGPAGADGVDGSDGRDGAQGVQGEQGAIGVTGPQGEVGNPGTSITLLGSVVASSYLPASPEVNDGYYCQADGNCWVWTALSGWVSVGSIVGPRGLQGVQGEQGIQGVQGIQGEQGLVGETGPAGPQGLTGESGANIEFNSYTSKSALVDSDIFLLEDSENRWDKRKVALGTIRDAIGSGFTWVHATSNVVASPNTGYVTDSATQLIISLPTNFEFGDAFRICGLGVGGWRVTQQDGQQITDIDKSTYRGSAGYIQSGHYRQTAEILCVVASTDFQVFTSNGTIEMYTEV